MVARNLLISDNQLRGQLAMWVCRQHPYHSVDGVDAVGAAISERCRQDEDWGGNADMRMRRFADWHELDKWLQAVIGDHPQMALWNTPKSQHKAQHVFVSRYGGPKPEDDFIDIGALIGNIARSSWHESERDHESDKRIDAQIGIVSDGISG